MLPPVHAPLRAAQAGRRTQGRPLPQVLRLHGPHQPHRLPRPRAVGATAPADGDGLAGVPHFDIGAEPPRVPKRRRRHDGRPDVAPALLGEGCGSLAAAEAAPRAPAQDGERAAPAAGSLQRQEGSQQVQGRLPAGTPPGGQARASVQSPRDADGDAAEGQAERPRPALGPLQRPEPQRQPPGHAGGPALQRRRPGALPLPHHRGAPRSLRPLHSGLRFPARPGRGQPTGPSQPGGRPATPATTRTSACQSPSTKSRSGRRATSSWKRSCGTTRTPATSAPARPNGS